MTDRSGKRVVLGTIDAGGVYASRVAAAGGYFFVAGTAMDDAGRLAREAMPTAPYAESASAQVRAQTRYLFGRYRDLLPAIGASLHDL